MTVCTLFANDPDRASHTLTNVTATDQPDGSQEFAFTYSGDLMNSYVAFGLVSLDSSRLFKVKFGAIEADTVTVNDVTSVVGTSTLTPGVQKISMPAHAVERFRKGWVAEMTVNGKIAGQCSSPFGFEKEVMAHRGAAGTAERMN